MEIEFFDVEAYLREYFVKESEAEIEDILKQLASIKKGMKENEMVQFSKDIILKPHIFIGGGGSSVSSTIKGMRSETEE